MRFEEKQLANFAPFALRMGLFAVFLLFGLQKLYNPSQATSEIQLLLDWNLANASALNYYLGLIEMTLALSFLTGFRVRITAIGASFMLVLFFSSFLIKYGLSINPNLYRDIGLLGGTVALFLLGAGSWSLDSKIKNDE